MEDGLYYIVQISLDREIEAEWLKYMTTVHLPDVMRTACFKDVAFSADPLSQKQPAYTIMYECSDQETFERYQRDYAPDLQSDHTNKFQGRFEANRTLVKKKPSNFLGNPP